MPLGKGFLEQLKPFPEVHGLSPYLLKYLFICTARLLWLHIEWVEVIPIPRNGVGGIAVSSSSPPPAQFPDVQRAAPFPLGGPPSWGRGTQWPSQGQKTATPAQTVALQRIVHVRFQFPRPFQGQISLSSPVFSFARSIAMPACSFAFLSLFGLSPEFSWPAPSSPRPLPPSPRPFLQNIGRPAGSRTPGSRNRAPPCTHIRVHFFLSLLNSQKRPPMPIPNPAPMER